MLRNRWWVIALIVLGVILVGSAMQRTAWNQGYMMGQLTASGEEGAAVPYMAPGFYPGRTFAYGHSSGLLGGLFKFGILAALIFVGLKCFRYHAWKTGYAGRISPEQKEAMRQRWAKHWHHHGPPWFWDEPEAEETAAEAAAEAAAEEGEEPQS